MEDCITPIRGEPDGLLQLNSVQTTEFTNEKNLAKHSPTRDYIPYEPPERVIEEAVGKFNIPQEEIQTSHKGGY